MIMTTTNATTTKANFCPIFEGVKDPPLNVSATNYSTPYSIPVSWKFIADEEDRKKLVGYRVTYRAIMDGGVKVDGAPVSFSVRSGTLQVELTGLEHFVRYEIHISALTRKGAGPSGITFGGKQNNLMSVHQQR